MIRKKVTTDIFMEGGWMDIVDHGKIAVLLKG